MAGYTRQSTFADGDTITAALFNNEYNQLLNAFSNTSGHKHDGTANEGPVIGLIGDAGVVTPLNKVLIDSTNDHIEFWIEVSSSAVQQMYIADGVIAPVTDSDVDLGTTGLRFKDAYIDTVTTTGNVAVGGNLTVTGTTTFNGGTITMGDAATDNVVFGADVDSNIIPDDDDSYDLGSSSQEWRNLYIDGTANIDSLVADTADINGGTIDGATIATSDITVGSGKTLDVSSGTLTLADDQISGDKVEGGTIAATTITTLASTTGNITTVNSTTTNATIVDSTNLEVTNLKAKDGTAAGSIADSTGVVTLASSVLTTTDINGGTIDGATIATSDITVGTGKTLDVSSGTLTLADNQISGDKVEGGTIAATTITDLTFGSLNDGTITVTAFADEDDMSSDSATLVPTQQSVKAYVDSQVTAQDLDFQGDSGGALSIDLDSESLTIAGGTGLDTVGSGNTVTVNIDSTVATLTGTQTLTNKTLTSPVINTSVSGTAFLDDDTFATATASTLASSESIKAYVDTTVAATNEVVEDTTPQLGGDLDLNSSDITGTGNINITGTIQSSGNITGTLATAAQPNITSLGTLTALTGGTGDLNWDSGTLFVDSSANAVGIGQTTPDYQLSIGDGTGTLQTLNIKSTDASQTRIFFSDASNNAQGRFTYDHSNDSLQIATNDIERMRIDSSGNVGIGTTSPARKVQIQDTSSTVYLSLVGPTNAGAGIMFGDSDDETVGRVTYDNSNNGMQFWTNDSERMRIDSSGNVGIGTSSPAAALHVSGDSIANTFKLIANTSVSGSDATIFRPADNTMAFSTNGGERMRIDSSGNVLVGGTSSVYNAANRVSLEVNGATNSILALNAGGAAGSYLYHSTGSNLDLFNTQNGWLRFATNDTERMRIDASGNVGIGTSSPSNALDITRPSGTKTAIRLLQTGYESWEVGIPASNTALTFANSGSERMRIDSSGNLLVGTTTLADVNNIITNHLFEGANSTAGNAAVGVYNSTGTANCPAFNVLNRDASTDTTNRFVQFYANVTSSGATAMGGIVGNGASNVQFATLSDEREKENITPVNNVLDKLMNLNVVSFDWKKNDEHVKAGFIAQNVEEHFPEYVIENIANDGEESRKGTTGGMSAGYIAVLTKAIQEQQTQIDALQSEINLLKGE
jgi:hypothetical protein